MEGREDIFKELKEKFVSTFTVSPAPAVFYGTKIFGRQVMIHINSCMIQLCTFLHGLTLSH